MSVSAVPLLRIGDRRARTAEWVRRAMLDTRQRLDGIGRRLHVAKRRGAPFDLEHEVGTLLAGLRSDLDRVFRPEMRRNVHAQERHREGERPNAFALRDVNEAAAGRFLVDADRDTVIVIGPRGRTHVFSQDGRHVTSMVLAPGELDRKAGKVRWRIMSRSDVDRFRARLA